jgi:hypothetical protein
VHGATAGVAHVGRGVVPRAGTEGGAIMGLPYEDDSTSPDAGRYTDDLTSPGYDGYSHDPATSGGYEDADEYDFDEDDDLDLDDDEPDDDELGGQPGWDPGAGQTGGLGQM